MQPEPMEPESMQPDRLEPDRLEPDRLEPERPEPERPEPERIEPGRTLALDVGDRRIGLAITDALNLTAQPLFTVHRTSLRADLKVIARFIRKHNVATLVVGNPVHADGNPSPQSAKALAFAQALFAEHPTLAHHLLDERLTTREAHELLGPRHTATHRLQRKDIIDQVAATLLLEAFLSHRNGPALLPDPDLQP